MNRGAVHLREWRGERTQAQACAALGGLDQSLYSKLERGERKPTRTLSVSIRQVTGTEVEWWDEPVDGEIASTQAAEAAG